MRTSQLLVLLTFLLVSCYNTDDFFEKFDRELLPKVKISPKGGVLANGADTAHIDVVFDLRSNRDLVKVNFKTEQGVFLENGDAEYSAEEPIGNDTALVISAKLKTTTKAGNHLITIEVPEVYKAIRPINFNKAYPVSIKTSTSRFAVERTFRDEIQLNAQLASTQGTPSQGTVVEFIVADSLSSTNSALFRSISTSNASGLSSVLFTPGDFGGYTGPVSYKAITVGENEEMIMVQGTFQIIEPE